MDTKTNAEWPNLERTKTIISINVKLFIFTTKKSNKKLVDDIRQGLKSCKENPIVIEDFTQRKAIARGDLVFQVANINNRLSKYLSDKGIDKFIFDTGFIRRSSYVIGLNGIKNDAIFFFEESPNPKRFYDSGIKIEPWKKSDNKSILILGQTIFTLGESYIDWVDEIICKVKYYYPSKKILYSPHPNSINSPSVLNNEFYLQYKHIDIVKPNLKILSTMIDFCIGKTTNAVVEMIIRGVPVYTDDKRCIAYDLSSYDLTKKIYPNREKWLYNLANFEYDRKEIKRGLFWEFLKDKYLKYRDEKKIQANLPSD